MAGAARRARAEVRWAFLAASEQLGVVRMLSSAELLAGSRSYTVRVCGTPETIVIPQPPAAGPPPSYVIGKAGTWRLGPAWYAVLPDVRLLGATAVTVTADHQIVAESVAPENYAVRGGIACGSVLRARWSRRAEPKIEAACSLVGYWSRSYFHWLVEFLPRLRALESYVADTGDQPPLVIDGAPTAWQRESLRLLGYGAARVCPWNGRTLRIGRLVLPSFPRRYCEPGRRFSAISPAAVAWLRDRLIGSVGPADAGPRRILIARAPASGRAVENGAELRQSLARLGFTEVELDDMPFSDQVHLFAEAEVIVGPHGAGLANMLFARRPAVIELVGSYGNASFLTLAASVGARYAVCPCRPVATGHPYRANIHVDVNALRTLLASLDIRG